MDEIKRVLVDESDNTYIVTDRNVLFLNKEHCFPFKSKFKEVHKCFEMGGYYYVHHGTLLSVFDQNLDVVWLAFFDNLVIDSVSYSTVYDTIAVLIKGVSVIYHDVSRGTYEDTCLLGSGKVEAHHIEGSYFLCFSENQTDFYKLGKKVEYDKSYAMSIDTFNRIVRGEVMITNLDKMTLLMKVTSSPTFFFNKCHIFTDNSILYCAHHISMWKSVVVPLLEILGVSEYDQVRREEDGLIVVRLPKDTVIKIQNFSRQVLFIKDKWYTVDHNGLHHVDVVSIAYENHRSRDIEWEFVTIDVENDTSFLDQLINIIPQIYRLGRELAYSFEMVDSSGSVTSYGEGVDRHVCDTVRKEIEILFKDDLRSLNVSQARKLGRLIYFFAYEFQERFKYIHPYVFLLLSKNEMYEHLVLLALFKQDPVLINHYRTFSADIRQLHDLDLGLESIDDYVQYVISNDLDDDAKRKYEELVMGYKDIECHSFRAAFCKEMRADYYISILLRRSATYFDVEFIHESKEDRKYVTEMSKRFMEILAESSNKQQKAFVKNITGNMFYEGKIFISMVDDESVTNDYKIITCDTKLIIYNSPDVDKISHMAEMLMIEDCHLVN